MKKSQTGPDLQTPGQRGDTNMESPEFSVADEPGTGDLEETILVSEDPMDISPAAGEMEGAEEAETIDGNDPDLVGENAELKDLLQHTRADFENFRKQTEKQRAQAMESAKYATVLKFLPLVDDFSRALATYPEQLAPLKKSFEKTLEKLGLEMIDSNLGTDFDPDYHEAVSVDDADGEKEVIAETLRPGYLYEGSVLRPAMVKVTHQ